MLIAYYYFMDLNVCNVKINVLTMFLLTNVQKDSFGAFCPKTGCQTNVIRDNKQTGAILL